MKRFSLVDNEAIRKHLANRSTSKMAHAFSKSQRFLPATPEYQQTYTDANKLLIVIVRHSTNDEVALDLETGTKIIR